MDDTSLRLGEQFRDSTFFSKQPLTAITFEVSKIGNSCTLYSLPLENARFILRSFLGEVAVR